MKYEKSCNTKQTLFMVLRAGRQPKFWALCDSLGQSKLDESKARSMACDLTHFYKGLMDVPNMELFKN